jgi:hypothetical protein
MRYQRTPSVVVVQRLQRRVSLKSAYRYWKALVERLTKRRECRLMVARTRCALRRSEERTWSPAVHTEYLAPQARCFSIVAATVGAVCLSSEIEYQLSVRKARGKQESDEKAASAQVESWNELSTPGTL